MADGSLKDHSCSVNCTCYCHAPLALELSLHQLKALIEIALIFYKSF